MKTSIAAVTLAIATLAQPAAAQDRPKAALEFAGGALYFPDDAAATEAMFGGTGRFYVSPRISVGPEIAFVQGENHSHVMLTGNLTVDLGRPGSRVMPFVVAGAGLFRTNETAPNNTSFSHNEGAFTAGGGVRGRIGDYLIVGAEARIGWEAHVRYNGFLGFSF